MASPSVTSTARFLILFDFDETMIAESSDDALVRIAPGQTIPDWVKDNFHPGQYNQNTQCVLAYLAQQGVSEGAIREAIEDIPPAPGLLALLSFLLSHRQDFECAVVSDANSYFIETWLRKTGARQLFSEIFTNPATFNKDGHLMLVPFHSHGCSTCPENMCKQVILRDYLAKRARERGKPFQKVFYIGDGGNDICPTLALGQGDTAFPRRDFPMHQIIQGMQRGQPGIYKATVVPWARGEDVINCLKKAVEER